ncbi:MAG: riboflavin biosynthesis protein RibF, partial [Chloroflexi bacterium]|nr:riboflavin biosynthesis protein RibF [Chloroflexota bacterium]
FKPQYITSFKDRIRLIKDCDVDFVVPVTFDEELSRLRSSEFVDMLKSRLHMKGLVVGPDFAMGYKREGTVEALAECGQENDFFVEVVDLLEDGDIAVRSTSIRRTLAAGDLKTANSMLGRRFELEGLVVEGAKRGRTIGYPTANIDIDRGMICPANGIYATFAGFEGEQHEAATNIGTRPTFDDGDRTVEAFVLDFDGDLYGETVRLHFVKKLRDELKFDSVDELLVRMGEDVKETRAILHAARQA